MTKKPLGNLSLIITDPVLRPYIGKAIEAEAAKLKITGATALGQLMGVHNMTAYRTLQGEVGWSIVPQLEDALVVSIDTILESAQDLYDHDTGPEFDPVTFWRQAVRELEERNGLTKRGMMKKLGLAEKSVIALRNGRPRPEHDAALQKAFGIGIEYLRSRTTALRRLCTLDKDEVEECSIGADLI